MRSNKLRGSQMYSVAVLLTITGGFFEAYTYFERDGVFANAQTGNIVKFAIALAQGHFQDGLRFIPPIIAFIVGIGLTLLIHTYFHKKNLHIIRRVILFIEILVCIIIAMIPADPHLNIVANTLVSLICAMQMEAFQKFEGQMITTTVSTGNLKKAVEQLHRYFIHNDKDSLHQSLITFSIILIFMSGVILGVLASKAGGRYSILMALIPLLGAIFLITYKQLYDRSHQA